MESVKIIDIFVETDNDKRFMIEIPNKIKVVDLEAIIIKNKLNNGDFKLLYKEKKYSKKDGKINELLNFEQQDIIYVSNNVIKELCQLNADLHKNPYLDEGDMKTIQVSGFLQLFLFRYISRNIKNISILDKISKEHIPNINNFKDIISDLNKAIKIKITDDSQKDIISQLEEENGNNILAYSNYINSLKITKKEIEKLINLIFDKKTQKDIIKFWSVLSKYQTFNEYFEKDFKKAIEKSYFDFCLIGLSLYPQERRATFLEKIRECPNVVIKFLFHGTRIDPIAKILTGGFKYAKRPLFGMGVYFSDQLDYISFYTGGKSSEFEERRKNFGRIIKVGEKISCIAAEVYYNSELKKNIYDDSLGFSEKEFEELEKKDFPTYYEIITKYNDRKVQENGVHFVRVDGFNGSVKNLEEINKEKKEGKFMGNEYVITEQDQMLPLFGLSLKRNEYFVVWRDPGFTFENRHSNYLKERRQFIYKEAKMNGFFDSSAERLLEIIRRKKYNKIILLSNCGIDLSGKKFVEVSRKILKFDVPVLFYSSNKNHLNWIKDFPNALYTNEDNFYEKYITNYNKEGLLNLKEEIESKYKKKLKFTKNFLDFPLFIEDKEYSSYNFEKINPYFRKVIIKNRKYKKSLLKNKDGNVELVSSVVLETGPFIWYVTLLDGEITLFSNNSYLYFDRNSDTAKNKGMERFNYEKRNDYYLIYFKNKNNVLTVNGNKILFTKEENSKKQSQLFDLIDEYID